MSNQQLRSYEDRAMAKSLICQTGGEPLAQGERFIHNTIEAKKPRVWKHCIESNTKLPF